MRTVATFGAWRIVDSAAPPDCPILPCIIESDLGSFALVVEATMDGHLEIPESLWRAAAEYAPTSVCVWLPYEWSWRQLHASIVEARLGKLSLSWPEWFIVDRPFGNVLTEDPVPTWASPYVHLHAHSEMSALDGYSTCAEMVEVAVAQGAPAIAITDHGVCSGHPEMFNAANDAGIKPILGIEANFVDDRNWRPMAKPTKAQLDALPADEAAALEARWTEEQKRGRDYWHLVLWAETDEGLRNLWRMHNESQRRDGAFYYRPRMDWDVLERHSEGVIASTACLRGPLTRAILAEDHEMATARLGKLQSIFGDRLYVELHTNDMPAQVEANLRLVEMAHRHGLPVVAVSDSHYPKVEHQQCHQVWIAVQTDKNLTEDADLFAGDQSYHLMSASEARNSLAYLGPIGEEAVANTLLVADRCNASLVRRTALPVFSRRPTREESEARDLEKFYEQIMDGWRRKVEPKIARKPEMADQYLDRLKTEASMIVEKGFVGYFLMVADYCLDPSTPVLTEDLRWVEVGDLEVGDRLAGFDENRVYRSTDRVKAHRYWRSSEVVSTKRVVLPTYRVTLSDGTETVASGDHQWLVACPSKSAIRWVRTEDLKVGQRPQRLTNVWGQPDTWEAGYLGGILDGEGCLSLSAQGRNCSLTFAQKDGAVLREALRILDNLGFNYSTRDHGGDRDGLVSVYILGGRSEVLRLLGMTRAQRLIDKLDFDLLGRVMAIDMPEIVSIESVGMGEVVALNTSTGTLVAQGFAHHNCNAARDNGILVGPGRGSGGGCLIAWLMGIVGIDAVEANLLFSRFLTSGRTALPDFDVDFPSSKRDWMTRYVIDKYGVDHVIRISTHTKVRNKEAIKSIARALKGTVDIPFKDVEDINKIITKHQAGTAGLGLPWDELMEVAGSDLAVYIAKWPMLFHLAGATVGRLKSYGKHAAGLIVSPDEAVEDSMPVTYTEEGWPVSSWDMNALDALNYLKIDLLTLRNLDTLQLAVDLYRERHGVMIRFDDWEQEYHDAQVWDELCKGHTLGVFQFETDAVTSLTKRLQPTNLDEAADVITLVRPGPDRAGLTDQYIERRHSRSPVVYEPPALEPHLKNTFGVMIYQEQVMAACMVLAGYDDNAADGVRKILGKKKVSAVVKAGEEFVEGCRQTGVISEDEARRLWAQMAEFAKYCVTGDTIVSLAAGNESGSTVTVETLWRRLHTPLRPPVIGRTASGDEFAGPCDACGATESHHWVRGRCNACYVWRQKFLDAKRGLKCLSLHADSRIRPARILDVVSQGEAEVFRVELADGKFIRSTSNHKHLTDRGFVEVRHLAVGDRLVIDGGYERTEYDSDATRLTVGDRNIVGAIAGHYGQANIGYIDGGHGRLVEWYEGVEKFCADCGHDGSESRLEMAHLSGDRKDNSPENLRLLCASCHKKYDYVNNGRVRRWEKGHVASFVEVVDIRRDGYETTYDLVVDTPHNFVANGIVTSNSFNQAHAYGYAVLAHWCAWLKVHTPIEFLTALLSTVDADRMPEFISEARRMGVKLLPPDINTSGMGFTIEDDTTVRYGLGAIPGVGEATVASIRASAPYSSIDDFMERSGVDLGSTVKLVQIGAFDSMHPHRAAVERYVEWIRSGESTTCHWKDDRVSGPNGLPCTFDWSTLPVEMTALGRPKKNQPGPPKKCTKACRSYTLPVEPDWGATTERMNPVQIRNYERKVLGVYLSSTPFDDLHPDDLATCLTADQLDTVPADGREWIIVGEINRIKLHTDRGNNTMAFLDLAVPGGSFSAPVFASMWTSLSSQVAVGMLVFAVIRKNERGWTISSVEPVKGSVG